MLKYKIIIKKNHRADILRIDNNYVKFNFSYASNTVLNRNEVNLYYLPSSIFQYIFAKSELTFKQIYLKNIFRSFKPKLLIGHNIDRLIFESKKFLPRLTTIVYQHNIIFDSDIAEYELIYKNFKCDYFFVFDKRHEDIFSKIVDSKYIIVGSVKNNETKYIKNTNKDYSIINESSDWLGKYLRQFFKKNILGPEFPHVIRVRNKFQKNILIKIQKNQSLNQTKSIIIKSKKSLSSIAKFKSVQIIINVDSY